MKKIIFIMCFLLIMATTVFAEATNRWILIHQSNNTYGQYTNYLDLQSIEYNAKTDTASYWIKNEFQRYPNAPKIQIQPWMKPKDIQYAQRARSVDLKHYIMDFKLKKTTVIGYVEDFESTNPREIPWPGGEGTDNPLLPDSNDLYYSIVKIICNKFNRPQLFQESSKQWKYIYSDNLYNYYIDTLNVTYDKSNNTAISYVKKEGKNQTYYVVPFVCNFSNKTIKHLIESNAYTEMYSVIPDTPEEAIFYSLYELCKINKFIK